MLPHLKYSSSWESFRSLCYSHYDRDRLDKGNPRTGWAYVLTVRDLSRVLQPPLPDTADALLAVWRENWEKLGDEQAGADAITEAIDHARDAPCSYSRRSSERGDHKPRTASYTLHCYLFARRTPL